jgi:hypothetical protein
VRQPFPPLGSVPTTQPVCICTRRLNDFSVKHSRRVAQWVAGELAVLRGYNIQRLAARRGGARRARARPAPCSAFRSSEAYWSYRVMEYFLDDLAAMENNEDFTFYGYAVNHVFGDQVTDGRRRWRRTANRRPFTSSARHRTRFQTSSSTTTS